MDNTRKENITKIITVIIGAFIFCFGINIFIVPVGLYNGGVVGISQIIRTVIGTFIAVPKSVDVSGIINFFRFTKNINIFTFESIFCSW